MSKQYTGRITRTKVTSSLIDDETYDLRGLNLVAPDQIMPAGQSPFLRNCRMYARVITDSRVAILTRKGTRYLSAPVGQAQDQANTTSSTDSSTITTTSWVAQKFTAGATGVLTRVDVDIKTGSSPTGPLIVKAYSNNSGVPGTLLATSSIRNQDITSSFIFTAAYFMDCPAITSGTDYWIVLHQQDNGSGNYLVSNLTGTGLATSTTSGGTWSTASLSIRFKTYVSPSNGVKGFTRRTPSDSANRTVFAASGSLYSMEDNGTMTTVSTALDSNSSYVRFDQADDKTFMVNGLDYPQYWDGGAGLTEILSAPEGASHLAFHQGRLFFVHDKVRVVFSDLYNFDSYPSVNFFYVPTPKSSDHIAALAVFQDNLVIFTHESKHTIYGSDIATFQRVESVGTKGAVSQEAVAVDRNAIYFMADDKQIYKFNGVSDTLVSEVIQPELSSIPSKSKVRLHLRDNMLRVYYQSPGSAVNDKIAIYDITNNEWFIDDGKDVVGGLTWTQEDENPLIEFSHHTPWVFTGEAEVGSDLGKPIYFRYYENYKVYGSGASKKRVKRFRPFVRTADADFNLSVGVDFDYANSAVMSNFPVESSGAEWGSAVWGSFVWGGLSFVDTKVGMSGRGKHLQYRYERLGVDTPVALFGRIAQVKVGRIR